MEPEESSGESELSFGEDEEDEDEAMPAPFDVLQTEPEAEPPTGSENEIVGSIDYSIQITNEFSMPYFRNTAVLHLKMAVCESLRHLQPGDLNVYWVGEGETVRRRLRDTCLPSAIPMDFGDIVVINDGR